MYVIYMHAYTLCCATATYIEVASLFIDSTILVVLRTHLTTRDDVHLLSDTLEILDLISEPFGQSRTHY